MKAINFGCHFAGYMLKFIKTDNGGLKMGKRIIVAGLGHGGIAAAASLARAGFDVTVYEKRKEGTLGYDWTDILAPGALKTAKITFMDLKEEEDGKTISGAGTISVLPGRKLQGSFTFDGDTFTGEIHGPVVGRVLITDGHRI